MEGIADPFLPVPPQAVQIVPDRMEGIAVCHDVDRFLHDSKRVNPICPVAVEMDIIETTKDLKVSRALDGLTNR